jgi:hypothetical protein
MEKTSSLSGRLCLARSQGCEQLNNIIFQNSLSNDNLDITKRLPNSEKKKKQTVAGKSG